MKHDCPDCGNIGSVFWFVAQPQIWKCEACGTLLHPQEIRGLTEVIASITGYSFILDALSALNTI